MNLLLKKHSTSIYLFVLFLALFPFVNPAIALLTGIVFSLAGIKTEKTRSFISPLLQVSIVLMGFGMSLSQVIQASKTGFIETAFSVVFVMITGFILSKILKVETKTGTLIATGTAICGGSAIAAVSPVIDAKPYQISFSLIVIFILNAIALFIFPPIGHYFHMNQETFGQWAAIAIHDTSSVVGAGAIYGPKALEVATTVKLIRALWIIPLSLFIAVIFKSKEKGETQGKIKIPWFIALFVMSLLIAYFFPEQIETYKHLSWLGKRGMIIALFFIGANISFKEIKKAGWRSFLLGILLWLIIGIGSFVSLMN